MDDLSVVSLSGQYGSSCGYCGSQEGTSVAFGMTAKTMTVQARLLFGPVQNETLRHKPMQSLSLEAKIFWPISLSVRSNNVLRTRENTSDQKKAKKRCKASQSAHIMTCKSRSTRICWIEGGDGAALGCTFQFITKPAVLATRTAWMSQNFCQTRSVSVPLRP